MCSNMFRITEDPSSGSLVQCLAKNYKNVRVCSSLYMKAYTVNYTHALRSEYAAITPTLSMSTDMIESFL